MRRTIPALLLLAAIASSGSAQQSTPSDNGQAQLAALVADDARALLRNPSLPAQDAARAATVLLQTATRLDPSNRTFLRLLAEAARIAGNADARKDALRKLIASDPGDLVAQVKYIDFLALASQNLEERAKTYQSALGQESLDPQIRSEVALRLARLYEERGDPANTKAFLAEALRLNSVNVGALRDFVRYTTPAEGDMDIAAHVAHFRAIADSLVANPFQPDGWIAAARVCEKFNMHEQAADYLQTAVEQLETDGTPLDSDLVVELAMEQAIAGRRADAFKNAFTVAKMEGAPAEALLIAEFLAQENVPGSEAVKIGDTTQPASPYLTTEIRKRLDEMVKTATPDDPAPWADAAGVDLTVMPLRGDQTIDWIDQYAKAVPADDPTLARLRGWLAMKEGKTADAQAALEKVSAIDPLAALGLARLDLTQQNKKAAVDLLTKVHATHPTDLLALQLSRLEQLANVELPDTDSTKQIKLVSGRLTPALRVMHREPREIVLISAGIQKSPINLGEPAILTVRLTNTSINPLPVGADGIVKTTIAMAGGIREAGGKGTPLGVFALDDLQRVYRLEPRQVIEAQLRIDQGKLADLFVQNPGKTYVVAIAAVTAPRVLSDTEFSMGLGGQVIPAGDLQRNGMPLSSPADFQKLAQELSTAKGGRLITCIEAAGQILAPTYKPALPADSAAALREALKPLSSSTDPLIRAAVAHAFPVGAQASDADATVRLMWAASQAEKIIAGGDSSKEAAAAVEKQATQEKDASVKEFLDAVDKTKPH